jgi:hypothetical protein
MNAIDAAASQVRIWRENPRSFFYGELKMDGDDPWQDQFIEKLASQDPLEKVIALKACTGAGKSAVLGATINWFVGTHGGSDATEHPIGIVTSIDQSNMNSGIWKEAAVWRSRSAYMMAGFEQTATKFYAKHAPKSWYVEARTWAKRADPEAQGRAMSGIHGKRVLAILDEAGDIPVPLLRVAKQILSSKHEWGKIIVAGNPTSLDGALYQAAVLESHLTSVITITADPDRSDRGRRTDIENAREMIKLYGRDNPWVKATILGQFPPASINALLGIEEVEEAMRRHYDRDQYDWAQKRLGVDCARFGGDRTTLCPRQGPAWFEPAELRGARTSAIAARVIQACTKWNPENPREVWIGIDQTGGWGQGTVDQLIVAGYTPMDLVYSTPATEPQFYNLRSQMYFRMSDHVRRSASIPDAASTASLRRELTAATYTLKDGKLIVEDKGLIKSRLGYSPDLADGYAETYAIPDMPRDESLLARMGGGQHHARTEFDPYAQMDQGGRADMDFDPHAGI